MVGGFLALDHRLRAGAGRRRPASSGAARTVSAEVPAARHWSLALLGVTLALALLLAAGIGRPDIVVVAGFALFGFVFAVNASSTSISCWPMRGPRGRPRMWASTTPPTPPAASPARCCPGCCSNGRSGGLPVGRGAHAHPLLGGDIGAVEGMPDGSRSSAVGCPARQGGGDQAAQRVPRAGDQDRAAIAASQGRTAAPPAPAAGAACPGFQP